MNYKVRILGLVMILGSIAMLPLAQADETDHETMVTVNQTVALPGTVLEPGQYVFKLVDNASNAVRVFNADQSHLITTVFAVPAQRPEPTGNSVITLEERPNSGHEAIGKWFFAGETEGVEFAHQQ